MKIITDNNRVFPNRVFIVMPNASKYRPNSDLLFNGNFDFGGAHRLLLFVMGLLSSR